MLIQDALTGRLHEIPDQLYGSYLGEYGQLYGPQWGEYPQGYGYSPQYGAAQVVYDGLGNPVGIFPLLAKLAPLAAKLLPAIATKVLPVITNVLPAISNFLPGAAPAPSPAAMPQPQLPTAMQPMPDQQFAPSPGAPFPASMPMPEQMTAPPVMATPVSMPFQTPAPPMMAMPATAPITPAADGGSISTNDGDDGAEGSKEPTAQRSPSDQTPDCGSASASGHGTSEKR